MAVDLLILLNFLLGKTFKYITVAKAKQTLATIGLLLLCGVFSDIKWISKWSH